MIPNNPESEQVILSSLLRKESEILNNFHRLNSEIFLDDVRAAAFKVIEKNLESNQDYDILSVHAELQENKSYKELGGLNYLQEVAEKYNFSVAVHLPIAEKAYIARKRLQLYSQNQLAIMEGKPEVEDIIATNDYQLYELSKLGSNKKGLEPSISLMNDALLRMDKIALSGSKYLGLRTGLQQLDDMLLGLEPGNLITIAGATGAGKSALMSTVADNIITDPEKVVAVFELEMSARELIFRLISQRGRIPLQNIRSADMSKYEWARFVYAMDVLSASKLYIDDDPSLTPISLEGKIKSLLMREGKIDLLVVDYLQLMSLGKKTDNRAQEISQISRWLKLIAKKYNIPVIQLAQLNRSSAARTDKRPILSDLKESSSLEQDSDVVLFIYRDELYNASDDNYGLVELINAKQRNGPTGTTFAAFTRQMTRFEDVKFDN